MITLNNIDFVYDNKKPVLQNLHCEFAPQSFSVIVGESGCGKSTLLRLLAKLITPSGGTITAPQNDSVGFVFQDPTLLAWRNVYDNVALPLKISGCDKASRAARTQEALELVGLSEHAAAYPRSLSGGMRMRVSLARALAQQPKLLLMDEPLAALDERTRHRLESDIRRIWQKRGCTIIFVTHSIDQAAYLGERVLVMGAGRINETLPVQHCERTDPQFLKTCSQISSTLERAPEKAEA